MRRVFMALPATAVALSGCAVHPLPEDVQPKNTPEIVQHIRCEAKKAIQDNAIDLLREPRLPESDRVLAQELEDNPLKFRTLKAGDIKDEIARNFYLKYINSGIAYSYTFDMAEENNNNTELDFGRMLTANTVSLKLTGMANLTRDANRQFIVSDTFDGLLKTRLCDEVVLSGPNIFYPIAGKIGLKETISSFIRLNQDDILKAKKDDNGGEILYSDQLKFTTAYGGSVNPGVMINPTKTFMLTQAMVKSQYTRTDMNQVIIGLSLGKKDDKKSTKQTKREAARTGLFGGVIVNQNIASGSEARAIDATVQNRVNIFLNNYGNIRLQ
jgi:hypothetical protein